MDYATLTGSKNTPGSIAAWMNNSTIMTATPDIVADAESAIYRRLRHWSMIVPPVSGTMTAASTPPADGEDQIALPADCLELKDFWLTGTDKRRMTMRTEQDVIASWCYDGSGNRVAQQPQIYYFNQSKIQLDSPPDKAYPYVLTYFQQPPGLITAGTNFLTDRYSRLLRCCLMAQACEWAKDSGVGNYDRTYWDQLAELEFQKAQEESDRASRAVQGGAVFAGGGAWDYPAFGEWY